MIGFLRPQPPFSLLRRFIVQSEYGNENGLTGEISSLFWLRIEVDNVEILDVLQIGIVRRVHQVETRDGE